MRTEHIEFIENDTKQRGETITSAIYFFGSIYMVLVKTEGKKRSKRVRYSAAKDVMKDYRKIIIKKTNKQ